MEQRIQPRGSPARYGAAADDTIYISMCSGGAMVIISAAEQPQFILWATLAVAIVVTLVELAIRLAN
jgi:hypothetical protein